ncbi:MAG: hypothetical protein KDK45_04490 [Leptospiraceae bacterium]|nr:hypothetical protein [Leptospiraceae bacterium]
MVKYLIKLFLFAFPFLLLAEPVQLEEEIILDEEDLVTEEKPNPIEMKGFFRELFLTTEKEAENQKSLTSSYSRLRYGFQYRTEKMQWEVLQNLDTIISSNKDFPLYDSYWNMRVRNRLLPLEKSYDQINSTKLRTDTHRLSYAHYGRDYTLKLGRQVISWGQGRLLNPINLLTPINPFLLDLEDLQGTDTLYFLKSLNALDLMEILITPIRRNSENKTNSLSLKDTNILLRYKVSRDNIDYSVLGGIHYHSYVWGYDLVLTKWDASFRMAYLGRRESDPEKNPFYNRYENPIPPATIHQGVLGYSYAFYGKYRFNFEIFMNSGNSNSDKALRKNMEYESLVSMSYLPASQDEASFFRTSGRIITKNKVLPEVSLGYTISQLWSMDSFIILDPHHKSGFLGFIVSYNLSDKGIWNSGLQTFFSQTKSEEAEFANYQSMFYTFVRWSF